MNKGKMYWKLFWCALIFSCTASNGYAILAQMKQHYVEKEHWTDDETMSDYIALAQSAPGPVAISGSYIIGSQIAGPLGGICSVIGIVLPPLIMMSVVFYAYEFVANNKYIRLTFKGMQAAVCAFIISVAIDNVKNVAKKKNAFLILVIIISFIAMKFFKINVLWVLIASAVSAVLYLGYTGKEKKNG